MVGLDGATFDVLEPLFSQGRCPVLHRLCREGSRSRLNSTTPPMTLPSWSSFLTGCNPGRHGIFDFTRRIPGTYRHELTNATHRKVPTVHRVLSDRGHRCASIAMPTTYPPDPIDGVVISGFDSPVATSIDGRFCHPPSLYAELEERFGGMAFADFQEITIGPGWHEAALSALLEEVKRKEAIATWLLDQERWEWFTLLFGESDTVSHHFWMFRDPEGPRFKDVPEFRDAIDRVYEALDAALGRLLERAGADLVCVASDHGFGGSGDIALYINRYLAQTGWLAFGEEGPGWKRRAVDRARTLALRHLPAGVQQSLVRAVPGDWLGAVESLSRWGAIDFSRTRAFSDEMNYGATLHLNLVGRDPEGRVENVEETVAGLKEDLLAWRVEGRPVVRQVHRREEIYEGPSVDRSPDLVLELHLVEGHTFTVLPSGGPGPTWRRLSRAECVGGKGAGTNGSHRQHGVLILHGDGVRAGAEVEAGMPDCVPTLLALLGHAIPDHCDGRVIREALEGVRPTWTEGHLSLGEAPDVPLQGWESREIAERLERLGYL